MLRWSLPRHSYDSNERAQRLETESPSCAALQEAPRPSPVSCSRSKMCEAKMRWNDNPRRALLFEGCPPTFSSDIHSPPTSPTSVQTSFPSSPSFRPFALRLSPHPTLERSPSSPSRMASPTAPSEENYSVASAPSSPTPARRRPAFELEGMTTLAGNPSRTASPEPLHTPTLGETYNGIRRNLSIKSLKELEARHVQEALWRPGQRTEDPGVPKHRPRNLEQIFAHAVRGGASEDKLDRGCRALTDSS